jgi:hypothetical protein
MERNLIGFDQLCLCFFCTIVRDNVSLGAFIRKGGVVEVLKVITVIEAELVIV